MPRLRQVARPDTDDQLVQTMYDQMFGPGRDPVADPGTAAGTPGDWWTVFALVPDVLKHAVRGFNLYRSSKRLISPLHRELGQTRVGWLRGSQFVYSQHCKSCRALGMPEEKIEAISSWQISDQFDPIERALLAYTDALVADGGRVADEIFDALRAHLTDEQILEFTYITCMYDMHAVMSKALRTEFDDRPEPVVEVPAPEGTEVRDIFADLSQTES